MEYRINKIETDVRQKINEERSEGKVHSKKGIVVNKDKNNDEKHSGTSQKFHSENKRTEVEEPEKEKEKVIEEGKGHFIDIRK